MKNTMSLIDDNESARIRLFSFRCIYSNVTAVPLALTISMEPAPTVS